jgi:hypothetical protein
VGRGSASLYFDEAAQWSLVEIRTLAFAIDRLVTGIAAKFNNQGRPWPNRDDELLRRIEAPQW